MVQQVWLHIGTPKSGTSSLQKYLVDQNDALKAQGLAYISPPGKSSANDLAIAINRDRPALAELAATMNAEIESRPESIGLISSEMFYGIDPDKLMGLLPALRTRPLNVLVYLRRQDRYIEAMFLQKTKNGRFRGTIEDYIKKFDGSGSDYQKMLEPWENAAGATLVPRVLERDRLVQGNVVSDALAQMGLNADAVETADEVNVSPGYHRVQLLQAAAEVGLCDPRKLQRRLAAKFPQKSAERAPIFDMHARLSFLNAYQSGNQALRSRYFDDHNILFDESDLIKPEASTGIPAFTDAQITEITRLLEVAKTLM